MSNFITAEGQMKGSYWKIWQEGRQDHEIVGAVDLQGALALASLYFPDPSLGKVHAVPAPLGWVQGRDFGDEGDGAKQKTTVRMADAGPMLWQQVRESRPQGRDPGDESIFADCTDPEPHLFVSAPATDWPKEYQGTWEEKPTPSYTYTCSCGFFTFEGEPEEREGTPAGDLLQRTADIVNGARNRTHGDKERSFAGIAKGWQRTFGWQVKGSDVARAMIVLKEQRLRHGEQTAETLREHVEDICGYWAIYYELRRAEMEDA